MAENLNTMQKLSNSSHAMKKLYHRIAQASQHKNCSIYCRIIQFLTFFMSKLRSFITSRTLKTSYVFDLKILSYTRFASMREEILQSTLIH